MFFDNWYPIIRIIIVGTLSYFSLILLLRSSSNRALSQMNAFDFTVSVAIGSILSTVIMDTNVTLAEGLAAFVLLLTLQFIVSWLSMRYSAVEKILKSEPHLLFYQGNFINKAMKKARVHKDDIYQAARKEGIDSLDSVAAVVLEANGKLSIVQSDKKGSIETLNNV
ncbi:DUF421 domain-containing protein [Paenibacillus dakarensis]|uniref:DUF421 domain-containing protein n=1 Tax=Paenibacillus dakarensis TaxID=1527293 RepID=UPI0006D584E8|nr:YetF domain-containing protein [Paenibacillus dakarensis]